MKDRYFAEYECLFYDEDGVIDKWEPGVLSVDLNEVIAFNPSNTEGYTTIELSSGAGS